MTCITPLPATSGKEKGKITHQLDSNAVAATGNSGRRVSMLQLPPQTLKSPSPKDEPTASASVHCCPQSENGDGRLPLEQII